MTSVLIQRILRSMRKESRKNMNLSARTFRKLAVLRAKKENKVGFRLSWDAFFALEICKERK